jgi:hypothetical protein
MAKGKLKKVANLDVKSGASPSYLFFKVQTEWSGQEEYLLITDHELETAASRANANASDMPSLPRGVFTRVNNKEAHASADAYYIAMRVVEANGFMVALMFTEAEMERIRDRVGKNAEDIQANKESWLADLLD